MPSKLRPDRAGARTGASHGAERKVAYLDGALGSADRATSLAAIFPGVTFENLGARWPERAPRDVTILVGEVDGGSEAELDLLLRRLKSAPAALKTIVVLRSANVALTRMLIGAGASDVLPAPTTEPALALSLERLLAQADQTAAGERGDAEVTAILKGGGGVGATALGVQVAALAAGRNDRGVCYADLDLQFGVATLYLDMAEAVTIDDVLGNQGGLDQAPFATALTAHSSGVRVLGAPRELVPLDTLTPGSIDALLRGLRRNFAVNILDLPMAWTAWTHRALQLSDRIILVTRLTVPHIHLAGRQLRGLAAQGLDRIPVTLVCNQYSDAHGGPSLKAAERALGRPFDVLVPEDRTLMTEAINQGVPISALRRGTKLEKALSDLTDHVAAPVVRKARALRFGL